jgi:hypothetical protein
MVCGFRLGAGGLEEIFVDFLGFQNIAVNFTVNLDEERIHLFEQNTRPSRSCVRE